MSNKETCTWAEYHNDDDISHCDTRCDNRFYEDENNAVVGFTYCPWCGKEINLIVGD